MDNDKPTAGARVVSLDLSIERRLILRSEIETWHDGVREDLRDPSKLRDPDWTRRLGASYERLIEALRWGRIELPDEEARAALQRAADGFDDAEQWEETKTIHDAQRALLAAFAQGEFPASPAPTDGTGARTTRDEDLAAEAAVLQRVLDVYPARLTEAELVRELIGEHAEFGDQDAVERAVQDLAGVGLIHARDDFVAPTRAALRYQELWDQ